jgi:hypothetical protein
MTGGPKRRDGGHSGTHLCIPRPASGFRWVAPALASEGVNESMAFTSTGTALVVWCLTKKFPPHHHYHLLQYHSFSSVFYIGAKSQHDCFSIHI